MEKIISKCVLLVSSSQITIEIQVNYHFPFWRHLARVTFQNGIFLGGDFSQLCVCVVDPSSTTRSKWIYADLGREIVTSCGQELQSQCKHMLWDVLQSNHLQIHTSTRNSYSKCISNLGKGYISSKLFYNILEINAECRI